MQRPTWVTIVGVMGIVLGCLGVIGGGQTMIMPKMLEMQKKMMSGMQESLEKQQSTRPQAMPPKAVFKMMEDMWDVPEWFGTYCIAAGVVGLLVSGFLVFACIQLLQTKPTAIGLMYLALGLDVSFAALRGVVAVSTMSFMGMAMMMGGMFGGVISAVLLIVVATSDKEAFAPRED
ncbi:MAG: hypothetical protein ACYS9X_32470 [Planctomycetota bacterium]|jgi:hypothetical protein